MWLEKPKAGGVALVKIVGPVANHSWSLMAIENFLIAQLHDPLWKPLPEF